MVFDWYVFWDPLIPKLTWKVCWTPIGMFVSFFGVSRQVDGVPPKKRMSAWWFKPWSFFELVKTWPFKGLSDLQLGDQKVTLNHLVGVFICSKISTTIFLRDSKIATSQRQWENGSDSWLSTGSAYIYWLVVSTHLKNIRQNGNLPQIGVKIKNLWNHHLEVITYILDLPSQDAGHHQK